MQSIYKLIL